MTVKSIKYLALGDSYTIGEGVAPDLNFPAQLVSLLGQAGLTMPPPVIIAKTGWTTDELLHEIKVSGIDGLFDIVTLLIGVNNQYRGLSPEDYEPSFKILLEKAISFAGGNPSNVYVVSIPDWSATPFAHDRDREFISGMINRFNAINEYATTAAGAHYCDITPGSRQASADPELVTTDGLHPSPKEYRRWAKQLSELILINYFTS